MYDNHEISTNCSLRFWFSTLQLQLRQGSAEVCKSLTTFERQVTLISGGYIGAVQQSGGRKSGLQGES